uniref:Xylulose kinase-1 n=1 Tax=Tanacetum cinerariifolium TaxID=118510 RepID=A0A6L2P2H7_TANCI|nr:hypothetical protein [Tanacetum cinerariifolium]
MAPLTFVDTHNMITFLTKSDASKGFDQIVDFLNAHTLQYALMVNPPIYVSCIKQFWASVSVKKTTNSVKLQALIDRKKVVVIEDTIHQDLRLDDADGVDCLPNEEIFCMSAKRTALNEFSSSMASAVICLATDDLSSHTTKYTSPALTQKVFTNMRRIGKGFSGVETPLFATMLVQPQAATKEEDNDDEVANLEQDKVAKALEITKLMQRVKKLEKKRRFKHFGLKRRGEIVELDANEDVTLVDVDTTIEIDADIQRRMEEDVTTVKEVNVAEPTVFDDEEVTMTMAQTLIKMNVIVEQMQEKHLDNIKKYQSLKRKPIFVAQARKNMIVYLKNMVGYKIQHFKGMTYDQVRPIYKIEYNSVQTFLKFDRDEEPTKKRAAKRTLLQESFKKLRAEVEVLSSSSTQQDTPTVNPTKIYKEDVQNMLQIIPMVEFKVEALQVKEDLDALWRLVKERFSTALPTVDKEKALWAELTRLYEPNADDVFWKLQRYMHYPIMWKLHSNRGVHQVSSTTKRYDIYMLAKKDYPLSNQVITLMLSLRLQVKKDSEMARDLVIKIFLKANQPKSKSLDTSSK